MRPVLAATELSRLHSAVLNSVYCIVVSGLMLTSAILFHIMQFINITIDIRNVCVFLAPFFSSLTTLVTFQLTKELKVLHYTPVIQRQPT